MFQVDLNDPAKRFAASPSAPDLGRLYQCWLQLRANPYRDGIGKVRVDYPPLVGLSLHFCDGFQTLYAVRGDVVTIFNAAWETDPAPRP
jgi:hypothetical protein